MILLLGCIGLQSVPGGQGPGFVGNDPDLDTGDVLDTAADGNNAPYADAGGNQVGFVGVVVNLDGAGSYDPDGDALNYTWHLDAAPSGSNVKLASSDEELAQLVPDREGAWQVSLVVDDGVLESDADVVTITVSEDNGAPIADAGPDQAVSVGASVSLDGTGSTDADHDPLQYTWSLTTRPAGSAASLSSTTAARPSFSADVAGVFEATLVVSDGTTASAADRVRVVAESGSGGGTGGSSCGCAAADAAAAAPVLAVLLAGTQALRRRRR